MPGMKQNRLTWITIAIAVVGVALILIIPRLQSTPAVAVDISNQPVLGNAAAPVTMVVFEDFRCPGCASFTFNVYPEIKRDYIDTGRVKMVFVNFPVVSPLAASEHVARASECVYQQSNDAFWDLKTPLMRSQAELANARRVNELVLTYAPSIDAGRFEVCMADGASLDAVRRDARLASELNIRATPTVLVNGVEVGSNALSAVRAALDQALR